MKAIHPHLKIIASAGTKAKVDLLKTLGADVTFNYKEQDVASILAEHGPIDMYVLNIYALIDYLYSSVITTRYWDNTAGPTADAALCNMSMFGLIIVSVSFLRQLGVTRINGRLSCYLGMWCDLWLQRRRRNRQAL